MVCFFSRDDSSVLFFRQIAGRAYRGDMLNMDG